jgi:hypothetical protein
MIPIRPIEIVPDEPPGSYEHVLSAPCWCKPVRQGSVLIHRPWAECSKEVAADLLRSDVFPMPWGEQVKR